MRNNIGFSATEIADRIKKNEEDLVDIYKEAGYLDEVKNLKFQLEKSSEESQIRVVFIGQYTAGKSTIISALTTNKSIKIDSDISTNVAADYSWNGVTLTDTPGLYTGNTEHDARTIEMIKRSDLLIYCITSDLFNPYTLQDFEKWAFEVGYAGKMFLVINKMSKEAGEYDVLVENYSETLNKSLMPHSVNEFSHSFVDAKDYKDGIDDADNELVKFSHFEEFIVVLNSFIQQKGLLGKLDTPIMIMKASIDEMTQKIVKDDTNRAYNALLSRIEKKIDQQRNRVSIDARNIIRKGLNPITNKGYELSQLIGVEEVNFGEDDINELLSNACEDINTQLETLCENSITNLNEEIEEILSSDTASYFFNAVNASYDGKKHLFESKEEKFSRTQFDSVKNVVEGITGQTIKWATKEGSSSAKFFIKASEAAGSPLHKAITTIGHKVGHSFKPWEAAKIAKNIGNVAKILGPILDVVGVAVDIKETIDDNEKYKQVKSAQLQYRQLFIDIVDDLEIQYSEEISGLFDVFSNVTDQISDNRDKIDKILKSNDVMCQKLLLLRDSLSELQKEIF